MNSMRLRVSAAIIASVILIAFAISVPHTSDTGVKPQSLSATESVQAVALHDSFKKGVHTITGSFVAPNACTFIKASATYTNGGSSTGSITVELSFQEDSGVCLQVPTPTNFSATVSAPARLPITATVNGISATTTIL